MIRISSSLILETIDRNKYITKSFRDLVEGQMMKHYEQHGIVHNYFAALYKGMPHEQSDYFTESFVNFEIKKAGWEKIRKFNWAKHRPMLACMVVFQVELMNNLQLIENKVLMTLEDPMGTHVKIFTEMPNDNNPDKNQLVHTPGVNILGQLPDDIQLFAKVIDTGVNVLADQN